MRHSKEAIELAFLVLRESVVDETESPVTQREHDITREQNKVLDRLLEEVMAERDELREKLELEEKKVTHWTNLWNAAENELTGVRMELSGLKASERWAVTRSGMDMSTAAETARNLNIHRAAREPVYYTVPLADTNKD